MKFEEFLDKVETIHNILCNDHNHDSENYRGLDSNRDTEEEVETAIRIFPDVLSRRKVDEDGDALYPIQLMAFTWNEYMAVMGVYVNIVPFIPIVARLAIELGSFEEQYRGGLICQDFAGINVLERLMRTGDIPEHHKHNRENHELIDNTYLQVLIQLRQMGLLMKEDIQRYDLLHRLCKQDYFAENRFRFMTELDPNELIRRNTHSDRSVPLHYATYFPSIEIFRFVLECGMRYFPKKKGISLLFQKDIDNETPFQDACEQFGHEQVMMVITDTLKLSAAIDNGIHLDCVYLLMRREPDDLQKLLSQSPAVVTSAGSNINKDNNNNDKNDDGIRSCKLAKNKLNSTTERKRKREFNFQFDFL